MSQINIGDIVKSLDFTGVPDCYMIGKVVGVSEFEGTFRAKFLKRVWLGEDDKKNNPDFFTAPLQGKLLGDKAEFPRIRIIG